MTRLPRVSGRNCVRALNKIGFYQRRQHGSHIILRRDNPFAQVVVPDHRGPDRGTLRNIIKTAGIDVAEFLRLL